MVSGTRWFLLAEIVNGACAVGGVMAFSRLVAPEIYGVYSVTMAASGMALSLTTEWLQLSCLRLLPGMTRERNQAALVHALVLLGAVGLVIVSLGAVVAMVANGNRETRMLIAAGWWYVLLGTLFMGGTTIFQARLRARAFAIYRSLFAILRILVAVSLLLWLEVSPLMMVVGSSLALMLLLPPLVWQHRRTTSIPRGRVRVCVRRVTRFGGPLIGWLLASQILNISDRFLIQKFRGSFDVGVYSVTYALVAGVTTVCLQPILYGAFPALVQTFHRHDGHESAKQFGRVMTLYLLIAPPIVIGLGLLGADVVSALANPEYGSSRLLIVTLAFGIVLWNFGLYLQKSLELALRSARLLKLLGIAAVVNVVANLALVPLLGIMGAAIATVLSYALYSGLVLKDTRRAYDVRVSLRTVVSLLAGGVAMILMVIAGQSVTGGLPTLARVAICGLSGMVTYVVVLQYRGELRGLVGGLSGRP